MRFIGISLVSFLLTSMVVANAYYQKKQFYPSVVYITKSNPSMAVIYIQAFIGVWILGKLMKKIFFGQLRNSEFDHLMERSWYAITETCLAFTVFRDDFTPKFVALFTLLLFLKSFHWLAEDRVDYMERSPIISWLFHLRVLSLLLLLGALDFYFISHAYQSTITKGASVQLVFGFEYAVLLTVVINIGIKYALHSVDLNSENPWDNKAVFLLYTELVMGLIKVFLYVAFVAIMVRIYTLPLFAFRPMYYTIRSFKKAFSDVILSRRAIHNMNTLYPDATAEELAAADNVCIICREEMLTASKKLPCNHIFHTSCLRSWFQRQQTCPTCRLNILRTPTIPVTNNNLPAAGGVAANNPQQQQQQHQQQGVGPQIIPPNQPLFNFFAAAGAGPNPFQLFHQAAPAAAAAAAAAQNPNAAASVSQNLRFPSPPPPMFPLPLPFMVPPPLPPINLTNLSDEELRNLEGNERQNVEARIQCLRNIQTMLDAAVQMMQQYSVTAGIASVNYRSASANANFNNNNNNFSSAAPEHQHSNNSGSNISSEAAAADASPTSEEVLASKPAFPEGNGLESSGGDGEGASSSSNSASAAPLSSSSSEEEIIRRRRLEKFIQQEQQQEN